MTEDDVYFYWVKGQNPQLSKNFYGTEFDCSCSHADCVNQKISKALIKEVQWIRDVIKTPITITSAFRCSKHQKDLVTRGVNTVVAKKSAHEDGLACDMFASSMLYKEFYNVVLPRFNNVGNGKTFVHVDMRPKKADGTKRLWNY